MLKTLCICLVLALAAGCARSGRQLPQEPDASYIQPDVKQVAQTRDAQLVDFVVNSPAGATGNFMDTTFGSQVTVTAGPSYWCGLGTPCRKAQVSDGRQSWKLAVCKVDGVWRAVPNIFYTPGRLQ